MVLMREHPCVKFTVHVDWPRSFFSTNFQCYSHVVFKKKKKPQSCLGLRMWNYKFYGINSSKTLSVVTEDCKTSSGVSSLAGQSVA